MIIIDIDIQGQNGATIFIILDNTTELWMTKYIIGEIFSSGGATLYKNPSDQTVTHGINVDYRDRARSIMPGIQKKVSQISHIVSMFCLAKLGTACG